MKNEKTKLTRQDLIVDHVYEGKRKMTIRPFDLINDRQILSIGSEIYKGEYQETIQYDSPTVKNGSNYPRISVEEFLRWAKADVTLEMPKGKWRTE